jgi:hypothetical protein
VIKMETTAVEEEILASQRRRFWLERCGKFGVVRRAVASDQRRELWPAHQPAVVPQAIHRGLPGQYFYTFPIMNLAAEAAGDRLQQLAQAGQQVRMGGRR